MFTKAGEKTFVQCKQWKAFKVGVSTVRELYGVMAAHGASGGFVVTSGRFTQEAAAFASGRNIQLIDGPALMQLLREARGRAEASPSASNAAVSHGTAASARSAESAGIAQAMEPAVSTDPSCPKCGKPMVRRVAKRGAAAGKAFWGCSEFSAGCPGARARSRAPDGDANYKKEKKWGEEADLRDSYAPRRGQWLLRSVNVSVTSVRN